MVEDLYNEVICIISFIGLCRRGCIYEGSLFVTGLSSSIHFRIYYLCASCSATYNVDSHENSCAMGIQIKAHSNLFIVISSLP